MDCKPISVNTSFKSKKSPIGDWNHLRIYKPQSWNSLSKYRPLEFTENYTQKYTQLYDELNRLHNQAFLNGVFSLFNGGSVHDIDFSKINNFFKIQRSKIYNKSIDAIADAWKKVGDILRFIMGGK